MPNNDPSLLDRHELDAILSELETNRDRQSGTDLGPAYRRRPSTPTVTAQPKLAELRDATVAAFEEWAKQLGSRHQRRVSARLLSWEEVEVAALAETFPENDQLLIFETKPLRAPGFILLARPLAFGLLTFEFGGQRVATAAAPDRPYTGIEHRFLWRATSGLLATMVEHWQGEFDIQAQPKSLEDPAHLGQHIPESVMVASVEIEGLSDIGRVRIGIPRTPFQPSTLTALPAGTHQPELARSLEGVEIPVHVEIGTTLLSLAQLGKLAPGDELLLEPSANDGFLVRVGNMPKFHGTKGHVGGRLAIQIQGRVSQESTQ